MTNAADQLLRSLPTLATRGQQTRCGDPADAELWMSDFPEERALAATLCHGCPVITACGEAAEANAEKFGVWAGVDRTIRPGRPATNRKATA